MNRSSQLEQPLEAEALREIERSLHGRLKAHRLSDAFIERCSEEAIQKAWLDYLRAAAEGVEVENLGAFIANAAFCRAIDELRHESHEVQGMGIEGLLASERFAERPAEEVAVERLAVEELHDAIEALPAEERQILTLHYFEQMSDRRAAERLYWSESTFRRRRQRALKRLGMLLGIPVPEPGSDLAVEVGLAAWVCLGGARVAVSSGPLGRLARLLDGPREGAAWLLERSRELAASVSASGSGERVGALASGPTAKVLAGCAGAAAVCAVGGVIVTDTGVNGGAAHHAEPHPRPRVEARAAPQPRPTTPAPAAEVSTAPQSPEGSGPTSARPAHESDAARRRRKHEAEERQVEAQTSGIARAGAEASSEPTTSAASSSSGEQVTVVPESTGTSSSSEATREEEQVEQQFGAFK